MISNTRIRPLFRLDCAEAARVLADAFKNDPFIWHLFGRNNTDHKKLEAYMEIAFLCSFSEGNSLGLFSGDKMLGVALLEPPEKQPVGTLQYLLASLSRPMIWSVKVLRQLLATEREVHKLRPAYPHWYLFQLGIRSEAQRQGLGTLLLGQLLERIRGTGGSLYLETYVQDNLRFYERSGFTIRNHLEHLGKSGPETWTMELVRETSRGTHLD